MPIDPSIPLQIQQPQFMGPAQMMSLKDLAMRSQMNQMAIAAAVRKQRADAELRSVYADPSSRDEKGNITPQALGRIDAIDPGTGMALRKDMALAAQREAQTQAALARKSDAELSTGIKKMELINGTGAAAMTAYKRAIESGIAEPEARRQAQDVYSEQLGTLRNSGIFSSDELLKFPNSFDPQRVEAGLAGVMKAKDYFTAEHQRRQDAAKAPTTRTRVAGTQEVQEEWDPATRTWKEVGKGPRFKPAEGEGGGKPMTDIAKLNADYKAGRITKEQYEAASAKKSGDKTGQTVSSKMNPSMRASVELDIKEIDYGLDQIEKLKAKTAGPFFDDKESGNALTRIFKKGLTSSEQQEYETLANRFAMAIASIQSMGRGVISDAKINEAKKLVPVPGDSKANVDRKLTVIKRIMGQAKEVLEMPIQGGGQGAGEQIQDVLDFWEK